MTERVGDWLGLIELAYPAAHAQAWDSVGLQVGTADASVDTVLVCLDVTDATLDEAGQVGAELLIAHHPLLFRPLERLTPATAAGRLALRAAQDGRAIVAAHTNVDAAADGTTAPIMRLLGVEESVPLDAVRPDSTTAKLVVFVPPAHTADVLAAAFRAGAGTIGEYDECSFRVAGTGTFRPSAGANPAVGAREQRNAVTEDRVEMVVPTRRVSAVSEAVVAAHPYEEVAFDVYPLATPPPQRGGVGIGRVGDLASPMTVAAAARRLRDGLPSRHLRVAGDPQRTARRVAACGGAGDSLIGAALAAGADLYVTGDLRHHVTLDAVTQGLALIDAGHYATEAPALASLHDRLATLATEHGLTARLLPSKTSTDPWCDDWEQEERPA